MRAVIHRVNFAQVQIDGAVHSSIKEGLCILLGVCQEDNETDMQFLVNKISQMRIFSDEQGKMNLSVNDIKGEVMVISQFTLFALTHKGNRPSFMKAAPPAIAIPLYEAFITAMELALNQPVQSGVFGADMKVMLENDGPVTIIIDSKVAE